VSPVDTFAPGPPAGVDMTTANGYTFPTPSQPVEGFSAIIDSGRHGRYLAMPDNGFGGKVISEDFLIRAYYIDPRFQDGTWRRMARWPWGATSSSVIPSA
jgi:hypothetical protein